MNPLKQNHFEATRREFLASTGAAIAVSRLPFNRNVKKDATFTRMNLDNPGGQEMLESYATAVKAMLQLEPTDARNWYRNAFIHILDCPHRNWWFLPWHRGYLGWFEQTCRLLSEDTNFALCYWDWTAEQGAGTLGIPASFNQDNALNPANSLYTSSYNDFKDAYTTPVNNFYAGLTQDQIDCLYVRGLDTADSFWNALRPPRGSFVQGSPRSPSFDGSVNSAVKLSTIMSALKQNKFTTTSAGGFGSDQAAQHSQGQGEGILESQPHDNIHGAVSGFMGRFLSPVDPLFFMHHSNIDRLWDVWTRKQEGLGLPTLPSDNLDAWKKEPFLFYVNSGGQPVATIKTQAEGVAGYYATIGNFDYQYEPGSGEGVITPATPSDFSERVFTSNLSNKMLKNGEPSIARAMIPQALQQEVQDSDDTTELIVRIGLLPPSESPGTQFHVLVNPPEGVRNVPFDDPSFAGTIMPFGQGHGDPDSPTMFSLPITEALKKLRAAGRLNNNEELKIHVVMAQTGVSIAPEEVPLSSVEISAF